MKSHIGQVKACNLMCVCVLLTNYGKKIKIKSRKINKTQIYVEKPEKGKSTGLRYKESTRNNILLSKSYSIET